MTDALTTAQAARAACISRKGILAAIRRSQLKAEKFGRDWLIDSGDLALWLATRKGKGRPAKEDVV